MDSDYHWKDNRGGGGDENEDSSYNSKVIELLKTKVKLDNGEDGYVFTKHTDENPRGRFRCHVCNVPIGSTKSLEEHASGKNHTRRMQANFHSHEKFSKIVLKESSKLCTDVGGKVIKAPGVDIPDLAPGEPVPPGFEDVVTRVPEITSTLDEMKAPLIGLEYLAEITPVGDEVEPKYCCLLCNKRGDPRTVLAHLVCFNHRIKYIGRYFPRTNTALALIPKVKEYKRGTGEVLAQIVKAIENKFGRLNPVIVDGAVFDEKKEEYYREMRTGRHFYETADSNYELLVDMDFIKKCAPEADTVLTIDIEKEEAKKRSTALKNEMNKNKVKISHLDNDNRSYDKRFPGRIMNMSHVTKEKSVETISSSKSRSYSRSRSKSYSLSRSRSRSRSSSFSKSRSRSRHHYRSLHRDYDHPNGRLRSPKYYGRSRSRSRSRTRSRSRSRGSSCRRYRSSTYRAKSPVFGRSSFRTIRYSSFYNDENDYIPSGRPKGTQMKVAELRDKRKKTDLYNEYVDKVEKEMAKTLKSYKKNPEKHPLYPEEWKKFWNRRYKELTAEGIDASKHDFKPEWIKFWLVRMKELHVEELQMKKDKYKAELGLMDNDKSSAIDSDVIEVSPTPLEDDRSNVTVDDIKMTWKALTGSEIKSSKEKSPVASDGYELGTVNSELEQPVRVITVLRLLTALESQLGSLGPRVNNLFAQAIALEKKKPNSSDTLLDVSENNVLFETVKEKLKGQLFAGIVERHMVNATRTAIQNVAELFNTWKARKNNPEPLVTSPAVAGIPTPVAVSDPLIVPGIGAVDKVAIAQQIASALVAQGKTNVTEQELEQLINAVVGMAQATTRKTPTPPTSNSAFAVSSLLLQGASNTNFFPTATPTPKEPEPKPTAFDQLVSSLSKSNWSSNSGLKIAQSLEDGGSNFNIKKQLLFSDTKNLSEDDLKVLLQNFKDLTSDEQQNLISYLKELESKDPASVEKLRQFVGYVSGSVTKGESKSKEEPQGSGKLSPFSMREGGANPFIDDGSKTQSKDLDEDEDDYSYEDIYKAAEKKVSGKSVVEKMIEEQQKKVKLSHLQTTSSSEKNCSQEFSISEPKNSNDPECVLNEAKVMIANIMGQLPSKYSGGTTRSVFAKNSNSGKAIASKLPPAASYSTASHSAYDTNSSIAPVNKLSNSLINDYNYQDDAFGYANDNFQNYSVGPPAPFEMEPPPDDSYNQRQVPAYTPYPNPEPSYNYESWADYSQYPPPPPSQQQGGYCPTSTTSPVLSTNFNRPPGPYQESSSGDYCGNSMYNAPYREYY